MQLRGEQLSAHLERELKPVYVVYGDEPLLVIEAADAIRSAARRQGFGEREVLTAIAGFNWSDLHLATGNMSLFGGRKLVDLRIPTGKPGRDGSAAIQDYCARPSPDALLLVTLPGLDWAEEKAAWLKALNEAGVLIKLIPPNLSELPDWIAGRLRRQRQSAEADALRFIAERVEGNLLAAHQEIQKLGLLFPEGRLSLAQVQEAVLNVARFDLDGLREALLAGDAGRLVRTLDGLQQEGEAPPLVLWAMTEEIRALAQIKSGLEARRPLDGLLKEARVWGPRQTLVKRALQRIGKSQADAALAHAARIDCLIKGVGEGDVWDEFLRLGLRLAASR
ncbi:DNA polymerase III subunit delta [Propionivibrio limicola]|uniref:DNA polymerase III subunit delta n=1 Tax=Propionivibrio limicola TaxID=167645 RepID=UPI001292124F|nr:DNA polymerase III subunit delta [Propionivibrio limicola]